MTMGDRFEPTEPQAPAKTGGGCWKWVFIFGVLGAACMMLCCGVGGFLLYQMFETITVQPADVAKLAQEITEIEIPPSFTGKLGMKINAFGIVVTTTCLFEHNDGRGVMQLGQTKNTMANATEAVLQLDQQMQSQAAGKMKELNITSSETREYEIRGKQATFTLSEGQDVATSTEYREVRGQFPGKAGIAVLHLQVEKDAWDEAAIDQMLESIR